MNIINKLKILNTCGSCGLKYDLNNQKVTVVVEDSSHTLLHIQCNNCRAKSLGYIHEEALIGAVGAATYLTELEAGEVGRFLTNHRLTSTDVVSAYKQLFKKL